jgi:hypothetical protein
MSGAALARGALRGAVAAMAMTGMRRMTTALGLVERPPPEQIAEEGAVVARLLHRLPGDVQDEAIELAHWLYGAAAGAAFGALPGRVRRRVWSGPAYGLALWGVFETGIVPILGLHHGPQEGVGGRAAIAADHLLYGAIVGTSGWMHEP